MMCDGARRHARPRHARLLVGEVLEGVALEFRAEEAAAGLVLLHDRIAELVGKLDQAPVLGIHAGYPRFEMFTPFNDAGGHAQILRKGAAKGGGR